MREFLFRGKRKDNGEWVESFTLFKPDNHWYMSETVWGEVTYDMQYNITSIIGKKPLFVEVIPETVGQYTGLTDRNGRKIFEGDIISFADYNGQYKGLVGWYHGGYWVDCSTPENKGVKDFVTLLRAKIYEAEIIGNVHDHSELLEGGDENGRRN